MEQLKQKWCAMLLCLDSPESSLPLESGGTDTFVDKGTPAWVYRDAVAK